MKRVWCIFLVAILIFSAFPIGAAAAIGNISGISSGASILDDRDVNGFGDIVLGADSNVLEIPILWDGFDTLGPPAVASDITHEVMNEMTLVFTDSETEALFAPVEKHHYTAAEDAKFILTAEDIGVAKGQIYVLWSDGITESARIDISGRFIDPTINKAITALSGKNLADDEITLNDDKVLAPSDLNGLEVRPGDELRFRLDTEFFDWDPDILNMNASVRKSTLDNNKVGVTQVITKGKEYVEKIVIENRDGRAYVIVKFVDELVSVNKKDISIKVTLTYKGKKNADTTVEIEAELENEKEIIGKGVFEVDTSYGLVVETEANLQPVCMELGSNVYLYITLHNNRKHYAKAVDTRTEDDVVIMEYYPEIRKVLTLKMVNIIPSRIDDVKVEVEEDSDKLLNVGLLEGDKELVGTQVEIRSDEEHYVYDADGVLLGTTAERLPLRDKYYLAYQEIDFDKGVIPAPELDEPEEIYNPTTGAAGYTANMAMGILMLAAACVVLKSGKRA